MKFPIRYAEKANLMGNLFMLYLSSGKSGRFTVLLLC